MNPGTWRPVERLGLVITGGTIASVATGSQVRLGGMSWDLSQETAMVRDAAGSSCPDDVIARCPIQELSEDLVPADWVTIAQAIRGLVSQEGVSHVLVLHGTDTMAYTAAALAFLLADLPVAVAVTGSNLSPNIAGSDARKNVHDAVLALRFLAPGSYIVFAGAPESPGWVHLATRVRKAATGAPTFVSCGRGPIGKVVGDDFVPLEVARPHVALGPMNCAVDDRVLALRLFPGLDFGMLRAVMGDARTRGVVIELYASGTGPTRPGRHSLVEFVRDCGEDGVVVVTTVPASGGEADRAVGGYEYPSIGALRDAGALFLGDTLTETATTKLMWALGQSANSGVTRALMAETIAGEGAAADVGLAMSGGERVAGEA